MEKVPEIKRGNRKGYVQRRKRLQNIDSNLYYRIYAWKQEWKRVN